MDNIGNEKIGRYLSSRVLNEYLSTQQSLLPVLQDVEQLSPRVLRVLGQNSGKFTLQGTNTYIVGTGSQRLIIDTGQGHRAWADLINVILKNHSIRLSDVVLTHWHHDHTKGVPDLLPMNPDLAERVHKHSPDRRQQPIQDGQVFCVEGATLRAVYTPGHSNDHMCYVLEEENAMFTGDNVLGHGTSIVDHLGLYMDSLRKMEVQGCAVGYPGHGAVVRDLPAKIAIEIGHKERREKKCLMALDQLHREKVAACEETSSATISELIGAIHGVQVDQGVREMLEPFLDQVLMKLTEDGKVGFCKRGGVRKWFVLGSCTP